MWYVALTCRVLLAAVFAVALLSKLRGAEVFVSATRRLLPPRWADLDRVAAVAVAATELAVLALFAFPDTSRYGFVLAAGLLTAFTAGIWAALRRGESAPCRCFGASSTPLGRSHLIRNMLLGAIALLGALAPSGSIALAGVLLAVATGLVLATLVVNLDVLVDLFAPDPSLRS